MEVTPGFLEQLAQAYQAAFLDHDSQWLTSSRMSVLVILAIVAAFIHDWLETRFVERFRAQRGTDAVIEKALFWFRLGNLAVLMLATACYILAVNWP